jgi:hypothetical protein
MRLEIRKSYMSEPPKFRKSWISENFHWKDYRRATIFLLLLHQ